MATITVQKRTRALVTDAWGAWASTTDTAPFVDTDLVQYKLEGTVNISTSEVESIVESALTTDNTINISDITRNVVIESDGYNKQKVTGDGYFDDLMETINTQLKAQHDSGRIKGVAYAQSYVAMFQTALAQANQFALTKRSRELASDAAAMDLATKAIALGVAESTQQVKIDQAQAALEKILAETSYIDEQETQLINSVEYNNKIKAVSALADVLGTLGAGGLTVDDDMWQVLFDIIAELATVTVPTSFTVSKVE